VPAVNLYSCKSLIYKAFLCIGFSQGKQCHAITFGLGTLRGLYISSEGHAVNIYSNLRASMGHGVQILLSGRFCVRAVQFLTSCTIFALCNFYTVQILNCTNFDHLT